MLTPDRLLTHLLPRRVARPGFLAPDPPTPAESSVVGPDVATPPWHEAVRAAIGRRDWRAAQRLLQAAVAEDASAAGPDLDAVRRVRRARDRLARWPSSADAHLALGIAYFELELGDEALAEFLRVQRLVPNRWEGFAFAALEYRYRRDYLRARPCWELARARNPDLGTFEELLPAG